MYNLYRRAAPKTSRYIPSHTHSLPFTVKPYERISGPHNILLLLLLLLYGELAGSAAFR